MGAFGAGGRNCVELWESCRRGVAKAQMRKTRDLELPVYAAPDPPLGKSDAHSVRSAGRSAVLALAAVREAWDDARIVSGQIDPTRIGLIVGTSRGPADVVDASLLRYPKRPSEAIYTAFSSTAGLIASILDLQGCALSVSSTCTSGASAIYTAWQFLKSGTLDLVVAGGVDAPLIDSILQRMAATGVLSPSAESANAVRPFDRHRNGTVLGEGAAFLVLETSASAERRRARAHGTLLGAAITCEPDSRSRPSEDCDGLRRAAHNAIASGRSSPADVDLVHLHGTGTRINDSMESVCVNAVFGPPASQPLCWGSKAITGHTLGASSAFQAVLTLLAMKNSFIPGTTNCLDLDPACHLRLSQDAGSTQPIRTSLCLTSGFWGKNSALLFGQPPG
jgi:3-oxoacyl-[acyl-carrier-protein] synthase II